MTEDARFEDGREAPLNLGAVDLEDLQVLSALVQDAVVPVSEMRWDRRARRFVLLVNRLRHEDGARHRHGVERVQSILAVEGVEAVSSQGFDRSDNDTILAILSLSFDPADEPPGGDVIVTLAGDGAIRLRVEALELRLKDVTRPYGAPSGKLPDHQI